MRLHLLSLVNISHSKLRIPIFAFTWVCGLLAGALVANLFGADSSILLQTAFSVTMPFLSVLLVNALPIVLIAYCISKRIHHLIYLLIFLDAICFSFCGTIPFFVFGNGAWLIRCLFLFSGSCTATLIWWLVFRNLQSGEEHLYQDVIFASILILVISFLDAFYISPFLLNLSKYF